MRTSFLSSSERLDGKKHFILHSFFNGLGFTLSAESTIMLLALHFGAGNLQIGFLGSIIYISGFILLLVPRLFHGCKPGKVFAAAWQIRGAICVLYLAALLLNPQQAVWLIILIYTLFCITRQIGGAMSLPLQKMLFSPSETGLLTAALWSQFARSGFIARIFSFITLWLLPSLTGIYTVLFTGIIFNNISARYILKIPDRQVVEKPFGNIFGFIGILKTCRHDLAVLTAYWLMLVTQILYGFTIPFYRKTAGFENYQVFFIILMQAAGSILATNILKKFSDRLGSRLPVIASSVSITALLIVFSLITPFLPVAVFSLLGFSAFFFFSLFNVQINRMILLAMPENMKVQFSSMLNLFSALLALAAGMGGGLAADFSVRLKISGLHTYSLPFIAAAASALLVFFISLRIKEKNSVTFSGFLRMFSSLENIRALSDVQRFNSAQTTRKKEALIMAIEDSATYLATDIIRRNLKTCDFTLKEQALKSLYVIPRMECLPDILSEADDKNSNFRSLALFTLGKYPGTPAEKILSRAFFSHDNYIRSIAAKSLARIGCRRYFPAVIKYFSRKNQYAVARLNYFIAMCILDTHGRFLQQLFRYSAELKSVRSRQSMFNLLATHLGYDPGISIFFSAENIQSGSGLADLLFETRVLSDFEQNRKMLLAFYGKNEYTQIWNFCSKLLAQYKFPDLSENLKKAVVHGSKNRDCTELIAVLYFTFQLVKEREFNA